MTKYIILFVGFLVSFASLSNAKLQTFTGTYAGVIADLGSTGITVDDTKTTPDTRYKLTGSTYNIGAIAGIGRAWQRFYLGFEAGVGYNGGNIKKNKAKLTQGFNFDIATRIGRPIHDAGIMPYLRFALTYQSMTFSTTSDYNFHTYGFQPSLGVEFIVDPVWRIRAEAAYNIGIHSTNLPAQYKIKSKPSSFIGRIGVTRKLSK
tara:strand:- start:3460 stop:4074 length:615 start_codon:yes stop_codon:yes gene_type:complete